MAEGVSEVFWLCTDLVRKRGYETVKDQVVEVEFSDIWKLTINGKREKHGEVPPFHVFVECNGWPVTIIGPRGGAQIIGVSEAELIRALKKAGAALPPDEPAPDPGPHQCTPGRDGWCVRCRKPLPNHPQQKLPGMDSSTTKEGK